jgi:hypothetical protein
MKSEVLVPPIRQMNGVADVGPQGDEQGTGEETQPAYRRITFSIFNILHKSLKTKERSFLSDSCNSHPTVLYCYDT